MNGFNLSNIQNAMLGSTQVSALYFGENKLWPLETFYYKDWSKYEKQYFTVEILEDSCDIRIVRYGTSSSPYPEFKIYYSIDGGTWITSTSPEATANTYYAMLSNLRKGQKVRIKRVTESWGKTDSWSSSRGSSIQFTKQVKLSGNINSLIKGDDFYKNYNCKDINTCNFMTELFYSGNTANKLNIIDVSKLYIPAYAFGYAGSYTDENTSKTVYTNRYQFSSTFRSLPITKAPYVDIYVTGNEYFKFTSMFRGTAINNVEHISIDSPILSGNPSYYGFEAMFLDCTSLIKSPKMMIYKSTTGTFDGMFSGCTSLSDFEFNAYSINAGYSNWLNNTTNLTEIRTSAHNTSTTLSDFKAGKTVVKSKYYNPYYFTIESLEDNNGISFKGMPGFSVYNCWAIYVNGTYVATKSLSHSPTLLATLNKGDILQIVWSSSTSMDAFTNQTNATLENCSKFITTGKFNVSGYLTSLWNTDKKFTGDFVSTYGYALWGLFSNSKVVDARNLKFDNIYTYTYVSPFGAMFANCAYLERAPRFIKIEYDSSKAVDYMFYNCTSLYEGPEILIKELNSSSTGSSKSTNIFYGCLNLEYLALRFTTDNRTDKKQYIMLYWLSGTTPSKLTVNTNLWSASSGMVELTSYSTSKIPEGATAIDHKICIED